MIAPIDLALIIIYILGLFAVAWRGLRDNNSTDENIILAGRRLTLPAFVATLVSTWYGGILGVGEFSYNFGISNWLVFGIPYYLAAALFAIFIVGRARRGMDMTIPDRLYKFYGPAATVAGSVILIFVTLPVAYVLMIGVLLNILFGWPIWLGIIIGMIFSVFYVASGGFRAVIRTDLFQFLLMFGGFIILLSYAVITYGGWNFLSHNLPQAHFSASGGNSTGYIAIWYIIALATLVEPAFYQRVFAAQSVKTARKGIFVSIFFWLIFDMMTTTCGLYARAILPNLENPVAAYPALAMNLLPAGLLGIFILSLLATIMSTVDSYIFLTASTISHDLIDRFRVNKSKNIKVLTLYGLLISAIMTVLIAILTDSVVKIWHDFGSVGTAALLIPLLTSFWGSRRLGSKSGAIAIISAALVTLGGLLYPDFSGTEAYLFEIEPIFLGLGISFFIFIVFARKIRV